MKIGYTYEIIKVDQDARVMEVVYSSPGRKTMHIGARLPYVGETLEAVIQMYSPVAYWLEQEAQVVVPDLGTGQVSPELDPEPTIEQFVSEANRVVQLHLDAFAKTRGYDGILSACTYASSSVPQYALEGAYAVQARDSTWVQAHEILDQIIAGIRPKPEKPSDIIPELPALEWPAA